MLRLLRILSRKRYLQRCFQGSWLSFPHADSWPLAGPLRISGLRRTWHDRLGEESPQNGKHRRFAHTDTADMAIFRISLGSDLSFTFKRCDAALRLNLQRDDSANGEHEDEEEHRAEEGPRRFSQILHEKDCHNATHRASERQDRCR